MVDAALLVSLLAAGPLEREARPGTGGSRRVLVGDESGSTEVRCRGRSGGRRSKEGGARGNRQKLIWLGKGKEGRTSERRGKGEGMGPQPAWREGARAARRAGWRAGAWVPHRLAAPAADKLLDPSALTGSCRGGSCRGGGAV